MDLAGSCIACSAYTLLTEVIRRDYPNDHGHTHMLLGIAQACTYTIYGLISGQLSIDKLKITRNAGLYYTGATLAPVLAQKLGCDGLTVLLLRSASPVISALIRSLLKSGSKFSKGKWIAVILASISTFLASQTCQSTTTLRLIIGTLLCLVGTVCGCLLGLEQERLKDKISAGNLLIHIQTYGTIVYFPFVRGWFPILRNIKLNHLITSTITQIVCSLSLTRLTYKQDSIICQLILTLRRVFCGLMIAAMYGTEIGNFQWASLILALSSVVLYDLS